MHYDQLRWWHDDASSKETCYQMMDLKMMDIGSWAEILT